MSIGEFIKAKRIERGFSIRKLAELSNVSHPYLSQIETGKNTKPSPDILNKLTVPLEVTQFDLLVAAGYYTEEEIKERKEREDFFNSMTPEEAKEYEENDLKWQIKHWNINQYQEKKYVRLEDFLGNSRRDFYIDDHKLTDDDIRMLITLYGGKEKDYPSDEQIEKEYEEIKKHKEESKNRITDGKTILFDENYDINTNEDI